MSFNFFSLDYIYYPVSGIMWVWHKVFGSFMGASNAWAWVLSVVFLVFTLRALLFKPFMKQMDSQLKMMAVQPEMKKLREKYKDDRQRLAEEMMKLNKAAGVSPLGGCLPALVQAPVFIGLFHVLRMFQPVPGAGADGGYGLRDSVYFLPKADVVAFSQAKLFGHAPLSSFMTMPQDQLTFMGGDRNWIIWIGIPLTIMAGIATHLTSRRSVARQAELAAGGAAAPQAAIMNKLMLYVFPIFVIVGGPFFPLAILFYWLANNSWTFGQLWAAHRIQDRRRQNEAVVVEEAKETVRWQAPKPGARPNASKRPVVQPTKVEPATEPDAANGTAGSTNGTAGSTNGAASSTNGATNGASKTNTPNGAPKPKPRQKPAGSRPVGSQQRKKRKR